MRPSTRWEHSLTSHPHHPKRPWVQWAPSQFHLRHKPYLALPSRRILRHKVIHQPESHHFYMRQTHVPVLKSPSETGQRFDGRRRQTQHLSTSISSHTPATVSIPPSPANQAVSQCSKMFMHYAHPSKSNYPAMTPYTIGYPVCTTPPWPTRFTAPTLSSEWAPLSRSHSKSAIRSLLVKTSWQRILKSGG